MNSPTPILDRIRRRDNERAEKVIELRRQPRWIERMQERGLPDKDLTTYNGAFVPRGSGGAA